MNATDRKPWFLTAIIIGALYCVVGVVLALPSTNVRVWRLAAWVVSAGLFAAHIRYEHFKLRNPPSSAALHVAVAAGLGGFALAVSAILHSLFVPPTYRRTRFILAHVIWPIITGVPALYLRLWRLAYWLCFEEASGRITP